MNKFRGFIILGTRVVAVLFAALSGASRANADFYHYDLSGIDGLHGSITTTCDSCVLDSSDISSWSLTSTDTGLPPFSIASSTPGSQTSVQGNALTATPTAISFAFTPSDGFLFSDFTSGSHSVQFWNQGGFASQPSMYPNGIGSIFLCSGSGCYSDSSYTGSHSIAARALAAPEMDLGTVGSSLTLLLGALAVLTTRRPRMTMR
jgi:hypothetical protein